MNAYIRNLILSNQIAWYRLVPNEMVTIVHVYDQVYITNCRYTVINWMTRTSLFSFLLFKIRLYGIPKYKFE